MNVKEIYTNNRKRILLVGGIIVLAFVVWFVFRKVKDYTNKDSAEKELLLRQRDEAKRENEMIKKEAQRKEDSLVLEILNNRGKVEYKIIEREKWLTRFIDTASFHRKSVYIDSLLGPE